MPANLRTLLASLLFASLAPARVPAQEQTLILGNAQGAEIHFSPAGGGWRWDRLVAPEAPPTGWRLRERPVAVTTAAGRRDNLNVAWELIEATEQQLVFEQGARNTGLRLQRIFSFGPTDNVLRIETRARATGPQRMLARAGLLHLQVEGADFRQTGPAPASFPAFGQALFAGIEHVSGECTAGGDTVLLEQRPARAVRAAWLTVGTAVVGWTMAGTDNGPASDQPVRAAFLKYLESVRVQPPGMVLHSETWWTLPLPFNETHVRNDIAALRRDFFDRTGMFFDTYTLDLGWSDPHSFWGISRPHFPNGFHPIRDRLAALGSQLGLWVSPGSGYHPHGVNNDWLQAQGYEMTPFPAPVNQVPCFALGTRYQREFRQQLVDYARQYRLGHVIFDFMNERCDVAGHGHPVGVESRYAIDAGIADVLDALRAVNPAIALEPMVLGHPPSPWWLTKTPFILGPPGDDMPFGRVSAPDWREALITARDIAYRSGQEHWLMPTNALGTWDVIIQTPGKFESTAVMAIGRGRWFISSYIKPAQMRPEDWDFFAALIRWARHNRDYLANAWMIGGQPGDREAYGYLFRHPDKQLVCVRNPWIEPREIELPVVPLDGPRELRMIHPRRATMARLEPGQAPPRVELGPYETAFFAIEPAGETTRLTPPSVVAMAAVVAAPPWVSRGSAVPTPDEDTGIHYRWEGTIHVPEVENPELCLLVEGGVDVVSTSGSVRLDGRDVKAIRLGSAGQFAAAGQPSPDNWAWVIAPLPQGMATTFDVSLMVQASQAVIGVFVRGFVPADAETEPTDGPAFPLKNPQRRPWSQTLQPLQSFHIDNL